MATANPRRRAVTYGKTSRKPTSNLGPAAVDAFSQIAFADEFRSITNLEFPSKYEEHIPKITSKFKRTDALPEQSGPLQWIAGRGADASLEEKDDIYDLPSSDEQSIPRVQVVAGRKRRKITPEVIPNGSTTRLHAGQQRFRNAVGTNKSQIRQSPPGQSSSTVTISKHLIPRRDPDGSQVRKHQGHTKTSPTDRSLYKSDRLAFRDGLENPDATAFPKDPNSSFGLPSGTVAISKADRGRHRRVPSKVASSSILKAASNEQEHDNFEIAVPPPPSKPDMSPTRDQRGAKITAIPQTPPKDSRLGYRVTTPHQRGLWNLLLPGNDSNDSPSSLNVPGLQIGQENPQRKPNGGQQVMKELHQYSHKPSRVNRRKRIVDILQRQNKPFINGSDDDDDDDDDDDATTSDEMESEDETSLDYSQESTVNPADECQRSSKDSDEQSPGTRSQDQKTYSSSQPLQGLGAKATYARQRSFLTEGDLSEAGTFDLPILHDSVTRKRLRKGAMETHRKRLRLSPSLKEETEEAEDAHGPTLRSIHELRKAGGNSRLVSEIEAIVDDISDESFTPISLRRSRLLELMNRLQESSFRQVFVDQGFEVCLLSRVQTCSDAVENTLVAAAFLQLLAGPGSARLLSQFSSTPVVRFFVELLDMGQDIMTVSKACAFNMSKSAQVELKVICDRFLGSNAWSAGKPRGITAQLLSLQSLECLIRQSREAGSSDDVLPDNAVRRISRILVDPSSRATAQSSGEPSVEFQLAVSILESCTIAKKDGFNNEVWSGAALESILGILPSLDTRFTEVPESLRSLTLRLYLNLTNNNPGLCEAFSRPDVLQSIFGMVISHFGNVSRDPAAQTLVLDSLILSLGSLINLAEWSGSVRESTLNLQYQGSTYLDHFLQIFLSNSEKTAEVFSEEETSTNVAFGYLSVLISYLCITERVLTHVRSKLTGGTIQPLLAAVGEFLHYHQKIDEELYRNGGEIDLKASFTTRLQGIVDILGKV